MLSRRKAERRRGAFLAAVVVSGVAVFASQAAKAAQSNPVLSYEDRVEIEELLYKYSHYIDNRIGDAFASTFTPDGRLEFPGTVVQGYDQLVAFGSRPAVGKVRDHFVGDILLTQTAPGQVHARSMVIVILRSVRGTAPAKLEGIGIYDDQIVKTPQGWRFLSRHADTTIPVSPDFLPPTNHAALPSGQR